MDSFVSSHRSGKCCNAVSAGLKIPRGIFKRIKNKQWGRRALVKEFMEKLKVTLSELQWSYVKIRRTIITAALHQSGFFNDCWSAAVSGRDFVMVERHKTENVTDLNSVNLNQFINSSTAGKPSGGSNVLHGCFSAEMTGKLKLNCAKGSDTFKKEN